MTNQNIFAIILGLLICAVAVGGNIRRSDPHFVSVYPDVLTVAVAPIAVYVASRRRRLSEQSSDAVQAFGVRVGVIAGAVFASGLGAFALYWLVPWQLWAFGSGVAFGSVVLLCSFSAYAAGHTRITAV